APPRSLSSLPPSLSLHLCFFFFFCFLLLSCLPPLSLCLSLFLYPKLHLCSVFLSYASPILFLSLELYLCFFISVLFGTVNTLTLPRQTWAALSLASRRSVSLDLSFFLSLSLFLSVPSLPVPLILIITNLSLSLFLSFYLSF